MPPAKYQEFLPTILSSPVRSRYRWLLPTVYHTAPQIFNISLVDAAVLIGALGDLIQIITASTKE